ncbi:MAG: GNAT family protein [Alphaproteobacteria bacterium]|nr:GNAT family protein [Alphaproteobacteria bacterium]
MRLESERLNQLSPLPKECAAEIAAWFQDPEIGRYISQPLATVRKAQAAIRAADNEKNFLFGVFPKGTSTIIGYTQVGVIARHRWAKTTSVIGDRGYWGGRYATEMRAAVLDFLFRDRALHKVASFVHGRNVPAIFNNTALGYANEGILRQEEMGPDGAYHDVVCFGILREEWLARERRETPGNDGIGLDS